MFKSKSKEKLPTRKEAPELFQDQIRVWDVSTIPFSGTDWPAAYEHTILGHGRARAIEMATSGFWHEYVGKEGPIWRFTPATAIRKIEVEPVRQ